MRATAGAGDFRAHHAVGAIAVFIDRPIRHRLIETRPAGSGIVFCLRVEQRLAAAAAFIGTWGFGVPVTTAESALCTLLPTDIELFLTETGFRFPLSITFFDVYHAKPLTRQHFDDYNSPLSR